ncbi:MAG TPA: hypothetical protein VGD80_26785 [Kofleriaceae bacterium]
MRFPGLLAATAAYIAVLCAFSGAARAQDAFEIQVYDSETAARGEPGLEVHVNQQLIDGASDETHATFEPHYGLADWAELGGYFQTSMTTTGDLSYAGVKLRLKLRRTGRLWKDRIGLAVNGELSVVPARFESQMWGSEVRPIIDLREGRLYAAINPILAIELKGDAAGHPQLEPAAKIGVRLGTAISVGVEAYGAFGPLDDLGSEHGSRLFGVVDLTGDWWDVNVGAGYSWGSTEHAVAKMIIGVHPRG